MKRGIALVLLLVAVAVVRPVEADTSDVVAVITDRALAHGVSPAYLVSVAECESGLDPYAVGDHGTSYGLFQLSGLSTGLLGTFHQLGYGSAYSAWESADFTASVFAGEVPGLGAGRWSCA